MPYFNCSAQLIEVTSKRWVVASNLDIRKVLTVDKCIFKFSTQKNRQLFSLEHDTKLFSGNAQTVYRIFKHLQVGTFCATLKKLI